jgi:glycosyltransferase involved in cell wall biosynthesis
MTEAGFILSPHLDPGGTSRDAVEWANRFRTTGVRVTLLTLRAGGDFRRRLATDVPYEELGLAGTFLGIPKLLARLRRSPAAFVLTNCATSACLVSLFKRLGLFHGRLVFVESVNPVQTIRSSGKAALAYQIIHRHADAIVHLSRFGQALSRRLGKAPQKSVHIPNIVSAGFSFSRPATQTGMRMIAVGRLDPVKGYDRLIAAMPAVIRAFPEATLRICGGGALHLILQAQIEQLGLASKVKLIGHVDDIGQELSAADCFILTSHFEGMPNALTEAFATGLPAVATSCGGSVRRLLIELGAEKSLIEEGAEFPASLVAALRRTKCADAGWPAIHKRFSEIHDNGRNFQSLAELCLARPS